MKIKTKLIVFTIFGVFTSITVSILMASFLIQNQNQSQNAKRLSNAFSFLEDQITISLVQFNANYAEFRKGAIWNFFGAVIDNDNPSSLFLVLTDLADYLQQFGLKNNIDYGFYSHFKITEGQLLFQFNQEIQKLAFGGKIWQENDEGELELVSPSVPLTELPKAAEINQGFSLTSFEGHTYFTLKDPFVYEGNERPSGLSPGTEVGHWVFSKKFNFDLTKQGRHLGVSISIYTPSGKLIASELPFPNLNLQTFELKEGLMTLEDSSQNTYDSFLKPIAFNGQTIGYLAVNIAQSTTEQNIWESVQFLSLSGIILLALIGILSYFIVLQITKPIAQSVKILNHIAEGEGDLTQRMDESGKNELSELAHAFNQFIIKVNHIIQRVQKSTEILASSAVELATSTAEMTKTSNDVSQTISDENRAIQAGCHNMDQMVDALEVMFDKIKSIQTEASKAKQIALHGGEVVDKTSETMNKIEKNTLKIEGVVAVITEIANQTNLLSLNAAIEAAKAGDLGKGFAVVADEVRSLAEKSANQVIEIRDLVEISQQSAHSGSKAILEIREVFDQIQEEAERVLQNVNNVSEDVSIQEQSINDVLNEMNHISKLSGENSSCIHEFSSTLSQTEQTTQELSDLSETIFSTINEFRV